jgi:plasmid stabilization system protein ParE
MKSKSRADRVKPVDATKEVSRLYDKLVYWLYERADPRHARSYADRLEQLLPSLGPETESIFAEECRSLVHEGRGHLAKAIKHRRQEIRLIRRLHQLVRTTPGAEFALRQYSYADLRDRLELLAMLYHDSGQMGKAIDALRESKRLCERHGLRFAAEQMLREYVAEGR